MHFLVQERGRLHTTRGVGWGGGGEEKLYLDLKSFNKFGQLYTKEQHQDQTSDDQYLVC